MEKAPDAFRTISEVATWLDTPAHVLRFWESRFPQIKPVKRAGGRRYYRREDMALLGGIKFLLHEQGITIRGVQKILSDQGVRHVAGLSMATPGAAADDPIEATVARPTETRVAAPAPTLSDAAEAPETTSPGTAFGADGSGADTARPLPVEATPVPRATPTAPTETATPAATAPSEHAADGPAGDRQPQFAFGTKDDTGPQAPREARTAEAGEDDLPPRIATRLRAGARVDEDDLDTVRNLASRLSALQARLATSRPAPPAPR